jgi:hypothetical protein
VVERCFRRRFGREIPLAHYLWNRLGKHLPWVKTQQVSTHWIRHTILTWVERRFGFAVAQAYAGHQDTARGRRAMSSTGTYVRAGLPEVATALAILTGEPHPSPRKDQALTLTVPWSSSKPGLSPGAWARPSRCCNLDKNSLVRLQ